MYYVFLDKLQLPIAPGEISTVINGNNKRANLINDGEINILKLPGLTEISFSFLLPHTKYPFASYGTGGFVGQHAFLGHLERLQKKQKPFQFIVSRMRGNKLLFNTNLKVSLESYDIKEAAENGLDQIISVRLLQYKPYSTKVLQTDSNGNTTVKKTRG